MHGDLTPPLKWHGGKHYLAPKLWQIAQTAPHTHRVETHGGGLSFTLAAEPEGHSEVVNDLNGWLANFWAVLREDASFAAFQRRCEATEFSEGLFKASLAYTQPPTVRAADFQDPVLAAWWFFIRCRQSLAGRMAGFAPLSRTRTRRGMNEQASAWLTAVEGLPAVHARLKRVVILNHDALDVIRQQDGPQTLFYCDPPYPAETRTAPDVYAHEMDWFQHEALLDALRHAKGKFLLSGYRNPMYDEWARLMGYQRHDFDLPNNAASGDSKRRMTECVWTNF